MRIYYLKIFFFFIVFAGSSCTQELDPNVEIPPQYLIPEQIFMFLESGGDLRLQALAFSGREDLIAAETLRSRHEVPNCLHSPVSNEPPPLIEIVKQARETNVIILGESHIRPRHRAFTAKLIDVLWNEGYRYLAAETFMPGFEVSDTAPDNSSITKITDYDSNEDFLFTYGWYTNEPVFAELVRKARARGYTLIAYDNIQTDENLEANNASELREEGQAENLFNRIFSKDPYARVIIYAGGYHASEAIIGSGKGVNTPMAHRLKKMIEVDPLTISLGLCSVVGKDIQFVMPANVPPNSFDLHVAFPKTTFTRGRPLWRKKLNMRAVDIPQSLRGSDGPTLVEVRKKGWPLVAVPVDRVLVWKDENIPLLLEAGDYHLTSFTANGFYAEISDFSVE